MSVYNTERILQLQHENREYELKQRLLEAKRKNRESTMNMCTEFIAMQQKNIIMAMFTGVNK